MCSGCSGDYYGDFKGQEGIPGESDWIEFHFGNETEESQRAPDAWVDQDAPRNLPVAETREDYEIFVSETQITEVRVFRGDGSIGQDGMSRGAAWEETTLADERLRVATAKHYRTLVRARLLLPPDGSALRIKFASFCLGGLIGVLAAVWVLAR